MPKRIRREPIYIAPKILGSILEGGNYYVIDELNREELNPENVFDKIKIYERQVKGWFLEPALKMANYKPANKGFLVLMTCLSYIEGVEQYKMGSTSNNSSKRTFRSGLRRLYPQLGSDEQIDRLYNQGRCGLFHDGMVKGQIIIDYNFQDSIKFEDNNDIKINPKKLINDIATDFNNYIETLKIDIISRDKFDRMFSNVV